MTIENSVSNDFLIYVRRWYVRCLNLDPVWITNFYIYYYILNIVQEKSLMILRVAYYTAFNNINHLTLKAPITTAADNKFLRHLS